MTKATLERLANCDDLQLWINETLVRAVELDATETSYERGDSGLTVQFRRGTRVLETSGPDIRFQGDAIPRLKRMARMDPATESSRLTGEFDVYVGDEEYGLRAESTTTDSGERMVVRFRKK